MPVVFANQDAGTSMLYQTKCDRCGALGEIAVFAETAAWRAKLDGWDLTGHDDEGTRERADAQMLCPECVRQSTDKTERRRNAADSRGEKDDMGGGDTT